MKALITGITGQDGSYLAELLLSKSYEVHGIIRSHSVASTQTTRIDHLRPAIGHDTLHYADMTDPVSLWSVIRNIKPDEIYNLAAQSHVKVSERIPLYTANADALGVINLLQIIKEYPCKMYQASTSEMFGNEIDSDGFQRETTPMKPVSPYGLAKLYAHGLCNHYRNAYKLPISCGILFNHTSVRRGETFVEQKIVKGLVEVKKGVREFIELGNLEAKRDIGYAPEYVEAMWLMMQGKPDDYVIGTGQTKSINDIVLWVLHKLGLHYSCIKISDKYLRAQELNSLCADASKAKKELGWEAKKMLPEILNAMIDDK